MFGSLAFGIAAIFSGSLVDHASEDSVLFKYEIAFNLMAAFWIADIFRLALIVLVPWLVLVLPEQMGAMGH